MPAEIVTVGFCPQYYSRWVVQGSQPGSTYTVVLNGAEQLPDCTCPAFRHAPWDGKDCKHVRAVWAHGCLYNPQWREPGPNDWADHGISLLATDTATWPEPCEGCGQPMVAVRIAV
jgi:hypothetical protein